MPDESKHSEQEERNDYVYRRVFRQDNPTCSDWAMTAIFFRSVQTIDRFLASQALPVHPTTHEQRVAALARLNRKKAASCYQMLKVLSDQATFECARFTDAQLDEYEQVATVELPASLA